MKLLELLKHNSTLLKGSLFAIYSFFNRGVSFVLLLILANYIAPAEYGLLNLFNTVVMFLGYFMALSTEGYVDIVYFREKSKLNQYITAITFIVSLMVAAYLIIITIGGNGLSNALGLQRSFLYLAVIISASTVLMHMLLSFYRVTENLPKYGAVSCGFALLNFVITLIFVVKFNFNWEGRVFSQFLCTVFVGLISIFVFLRNGAPQRFSSKELKTLVFWGVPLIPHLATTWLRQGCDRYIINNFYTLAQVGIFSFALTLSNIIEMVGAAFNSSNSVSIFKILSDDTISSYLKKQNLKLQTKQILLIYFIMSLAIVLGAAILTPLVLPQYVGALKYFYILGIYGFLRCVYYLFCNYLFYWNKNKILMYITFTTSVIHLGLSLIFTRYSLCLTCFIYVISQLIIDIIVISYSKKLIDRNLV